MSEALSTPAQGSDFFPRRDSVYFPQRGGAGLEADDYLFLSYPNKKEAITRARVKGYSDEAILKRLVLYERDLLLRKQPAEVNSSFGRTNDTEKRRRAFIQENRIGAISKVTRLDPKEVSIRIKEAEAVGVNPEAFFADEDFYRLAKSSGVIGERMGAIDSIKAGVRLGNLEKEYSELYVRNLFAPDKGTEERLNELRGEMSKLNNHAYDPFINKGLRGAAQNATRWVSNKDLMAMGLGAAAGGGLVLAQAPMLSAMGIEASAGMAAKSALATGVAAGKASFFTRMYLMESAGLHEELKAAEVPDSIAVPAAAIYGGIAAAIESGQAIAAMTPVGLVGGGLLKKFYGAGKDKIKSLVVGLAANPKVAGLMETELTRAAKSFTVKSAAKQGGLSYAKKVGFETLEEMHQRAWEILIGEAAKMINDPQYKHMTISEAVDDVARTGLEALPTMVFLPLPGEAVGTARNMNAARRFQNTAAVRRAKSADGRVTEGGNPAAEKDLVFLGQDAVDAFFQENPDVAEKVSAALGITEGSVIDELGEVAVKKEDYEKAAAEYPDFSKSIAMDVREGAAGVTPREAAEKIRAKLSDPLEGDDDYAKEAVEIRRSLISELSAAGQDDELGEANADLYSRYLYTLGKRLGVSPKELHRLSVEKAEDGGAIPLYNQPVPQADTVRTEAFKAWFGDWENDTENASRILDSNGEPLAAYRGDAAGMTSFGSAQGNYFISDKDTAEGYAGKKGSLYPVYLNIRNPFVFSEENVASLKEALSARFDDWFDMDDSELAHDGDFQRLRELYAAFRNDEGSVVRDLYNDFLPQMDESMDDEEARDLMGRSLHDFYAFEARQLDFRDMDILNPYLRMLGFDGVIRPYDPLATDGGKSEYITFSPEQVKSVENTGTFDANNENIFYQPINEGVDVNEIVRGVVVRPKLSFEEAKQVKGNRGKKAFAKGLTGVYRNEDTGWDISLSVGNVSHAVNSALTGPFDFERMINVLEGLPEIIRRAKLIETHKDRHKDSQVKNIHRMYTSVRLVEDASPTYTVKLTVKEMDDGYAAEVEGIYRAYDAKVEKEEASDVKRGLLPHDEAPIRNTPDTYEITIGEMLSGVKDNDGNVYLQHGKGARGGITFNRKTGEALVTLFRTADRSTFIHEMGHLILEDLIRYGYNADPDTEISRDLRTVLDYLGISNMDLSDLGNLNDEQKARFTEAHEKWARAMELYVMDGEAPSKALRPVFQKMRMWLLDIYTNAKFAGEELTPEVQDVFDRLLSTPQEIDEVYASETTVGELIRENELLKERLDALEKEAKQEAKNKFRLGEALGYDRGKSEGERNARFKRPGFDYRTKSRREAMFERFEKRRALLKDVENLLETINRDVNDEEVIWSTQQEMLKKLTEARQIVDLNDTELDKKRPNRRRRKSKFVAVYPTQKMKMAASLMEAIKKDLGFDYKDINPSDAPFVKLIEKLDAAGMTLNDLRLSDAKLSEIAELAKEIGEIHARGRREYKVWRAGIVERRQTVNSELISALEKTRGRRKRGPVARSSNLSKQYDGVAGKAEKLKDWTYANTLGAIRLFDWIGHGLGKFDSAFSKYCVDEVNAAYDEKLTRLHERHAAMNAKMKELGITLHALSKERVVGGYKYSVDQLLSIYTAMQNEKSRQALVFGNMRDLIPDSWFLDNAKKHDGQLPAEALAHIGECAKALTPQERELADYVIQEYDSHYERLNDIFIANFNRGMIREERYTPMRRLEYTSKHGLVDAGEEAYAKGVAAQAGARKAGLEMGFLNPRVIPGKEISEKHQAPVELGLLSIWNEQIDAMEHTAAFARIGPDLHAVFTENFEDAVGRSYNIPKLIREKFGSGAWKAVEDYINLVNQDSLTAGKNVFDRAANAMGKNMAYTYLAANVGTVLKQTTSIPRFLITAGPAQVGCAIGEYMLNPGRFLEEVYALDPQMRNRVPNAFFSINQYDPTLMGDMRYGYKKTMDALIAPVSYMDRAVAAIGWKATYNSNIKRGLSHDQAVRAAQRAVLLTQQAPMIKDAPMIWRQSGLARLLMIFTSDAAPVLGMTVYDLAQSIKRGDHPASLCNVVALMTSAVLMKALVDGMPDDDDDESWGEWVLSAFSRQALESIPLVGKELMSFWESFSGSGYKGTTYSAFVAPLSKLARGYDDMTAEDADEVSPYTGMSKFERGAWNAIEGISLLTTPLPVVGARRLYQATQSAADGDLLRALQTIIGQRKKIKRYVTPPVF
ncbi:hypothetical protein [Synergistes jonesii]|uniref:Uncharacterized protein n=1 Tax=Synergistes jonesii TaxID=2754 RepID=A0A073IPX1_9BACT|nr:hypothetical protein [Synergistes jonesii]KEJ91605.1 hypothetical protein EH55_08405 [Synergistes jonesii]OFB60838.1 hypothetical protein JS73_10490 [Synergistes jonesii]OFB61751.1 hypothetical protein JS79_10640 [Synergistes jonesii]OFB63235.1 hypothetical protein JS72_07150 [Synergistes jonesii]OFB66844.1 hypothetical protein JS78_10515 [Synergistes jonesii]